MSEPISTSAPPFTGDLASTVARIERDGDPDPAAAALNLTWDGRGTVVSADYLEPVSAREPLDRPATALMIDLAARACVEARAGGEGLAVLAAHRICESGAYRRLGYRTAGDYARERLGLKPRTFADLARLGRRLARLPRTREALMRGRISRTQADVIAGIATDEDEDKWLELAAAGTVRSLKKAAREARAAPSDAQACARSDAPAPQGAGDADAEVDLDETRVRLDVDVPEALLGKADAVLELAARVAGRRLPRGTLWEFVAAEYLSGVPPSMEGFPEGGSGRPGPAPGAGEVPGPASEALEGSEHRRSGPEGSGPGRSRRERCEHEGSGHEGSEHEGSEHEGSEHEGSEHEGSGYEGSEHEGAGHENSEHEGSGHERSENEGSRRRGSEQVGSGHDGITAILASTTGRPWRRACPEDPHGYQEHLEEASRCWEFLPRSRSRVELGGASARLSDLAAEIASGAELSPWQLHRRITVALQQRRAVDWQLGRLLATIRNRRLWHDMLFASFGHYVRERLGVSVRHAQRLIRIDRAALESPALARVWQAGELSGLQGELLARVLPHVGEEEREAAWVDTALHSTHDRLAALVRCAERLSDERSRAWWASGGDPGVAAARLREEEAEIGRVWCDGAAGDPERVGDSHELPDVTVPTPGEAAAVDGAGAGATMFVTADDGHFPAARARLAIRATPGEAEVVARALEEARRALAEDGFPGDGPALRPRHIPTWRCLDALLDTFLASYGGEAARRLRDAYPICARDGWACRVPGCRALSALHVHHIVFRANGGGDEPENLVTLCSAHHRALHDGWIRCAGQAPHRLYWELGVGGVGDRGVDVPGGGAGDAPDRRGRDVLDRRGGELADRPGGGMLDPRDESPADRPGGGMPDHGDESSAHRPGGEVQDRRGEDMADGPGSGMTDRCERWARSRELPVARYFGERLLDPGEYWDGRRVRRRPDGEAAA